jgi:D-alanyl-lipoteichoic acid acyltransferase DltB (MBOAT superfamily)
MDSASFQFVLFCLTVAVLSNLSRSPRWRSSILFFASIVFLGLLSRDLFGFLPLAGFLFLGYALLVLRERGWSRFLAGTVLSVVFVYIWLKKYTWLPETTFLHFPYFTVGLSYIFFRVLHLLIEAGGDGEKRHIGLGTYLLYMLNFTTLLSGPIQRYDAFARDQFAAEPISLGPRVVGLQLKRIVLGFFKVNVLAMLLNLVQINALAQIAQPLPLPLKFYAVFRLAVVYPFFLYANFSGYIDIVIATAHLMRVRLPENFDRPFSATSFIDFWNRWHITLSIWLKTYVYNPLLVSLMRRISSPRLEPVFGVLSFFVTFFLVGIWHGRSSEFVFFGLLQGGGVACNKIWQLALTQALGRKAYKSLAGNAVYNALARGLTFSWFAFTLFWLWADWKQISTVFASLGFVRWLAVWMAIWFCATVVLAFWEWLRNAVLSIRSADGPVLTNRYVQVVYVTALGLIAFVISVMLNQPAPDIVYKAF